MHVLPGAFVLAVVLAIVVAALVRRLRPPKREQPTEGEGWWSDRRFS